MVRPEWRDVSRPFVTLPPQSWAAVGGECPFCEDEVEEGEPISLYGVARDSDGGVDLGMAEWGHQHHLREGAT